MGHGVDDSGLLLQRHGLVLGLLEDLGDALASIELGAGGAVEVRAELGKGGNFTELGQV